jgi:hypothetical protein
MHAGRNIKAGASTLSLEDCMSPRLAVLAFATIAAPVFAQTVPAGYPADYAQTIAAAKKEGKVVIYSALDTKAAQPLI